MAVANYRVNIPRLDGLTEEQRNRALEDFMREHSRQMELVIESIERELKRNGDQADAEA